MSVWWIALALACHTVDAPKDPSPPAPSPIAAAEPSPDVPPAPVDLPEPVELPEQVELPKPVDRPAPVDDPAAAPSSRTALADGAACLTASDCESGVCEGEGCDAAHPGVCAPAARGCTRDRRPFCGCDGTVFQSSSSCPGQRFAKRGPC